MKLYPSVEDLLRPALRVTMPGAERCPVTFRRFFALRRRDPEADPLHREVPYELPRQWWQIKE